MNKIFILKEEDINCLAEQYQQAFLAHAHEVDIDSILNKWETVKFNLKYRNVSFSQFLEES